MKLGSIIGSSILEEFSLGEKIYRTMILQVDEEKLTLPITPWKIQRSD